MTLGIEYRRGHIMSLDGLRGLAVLVVMGFHIFPGVLQFGWMGVDLFFVLSGFLISGILLDSKGSPHYYRNYLAKRTLRIFPLYYLFLIIFFGVFAWTGFGSNIRHYEYLSSVQGWYWLYFQNWLVFFQTDFLHQHIISHFWSLAIEEQFYIFWPFIIYLLPRKGVIPVCLLLIALSITVRLYMYYVLEMSFIDVYIFTFSRLDALAIGSILAVMVRNERLTGYLSRYTLPAFVASGIILTATIVLNRSFDFKYFTTYGYTVLAVFFGACLVLTLSPNRFNLLQKITQTRFMAFFGKYSYGLYVYHVPVYYIFMDQIGPFPGKLFVIFAVSVVIAVISYQAFEKHFLKLKSRFS